MFVLVMGVAGVMLLSLNKPPQRKEKPVKREVNKKVSLPTYRHIGELINLDVVEPGVVYANGKYLAYARVEGTNFSILSDGEKDIREDILISLQNQIKFPQQLVTSTVVIDTEHAAREVRQQASGAENASLGAYSLAYAAELEKMKRERQAMAQVSWMVISDDGIDDEPGKALRDKMSLLQDLFARSGLILTPLTTTEDIIDAMQQIMLPERLSLASETAASGLSLVKYNAREAGVRTVQGAGPGVAGALSLHPERGF